MDFNPKVHFWGSPCKRGHSGLRYKNKGACVECVLTYRKDWARDNPEANRERARLWYHNNLEYARSYYSSYVMRRECRKKSATPSWHEKELCNLVYRKAQEYRLSVDHIVPIHSDIVCGLHCWDNLQLLDSSLNFSKGNRFWPDMPETESRKTDKQKHIKEEMDNNE